MTTITATDTPKRRSETELLNVRAHHTDTMSAPNPGMVQQSAQWAMAAAAKAARHAETADDWLAATRAAHLAADAMHVAKMKMSKTRKA